MSASCLSESPGHQRSWGKSTKRNDGSDSQSTTEKAQAIEIYDGKHDTKNKATCIKVLNDIAYRYICMSMDHLLSMYTSYSLMCPMHDSFYPSMTNCVIVYLLSSHMSNLTIYMYTLVGVGQKEGIPKGRVKVAVIGLVCVVHIVILCKSGQES